jgi:hypothetical protein
LGHGSSGRVGWVQTPIMKKKKEIKTKQHQQLIFKDKVKGRDNNSR